MAEQLLGRENYEPPILFDGVDKDQVSWIDGMYASVASAKSSGLSYDQWAELNPNAAWTIELLQGSEEIDGSAF